MASNRSKSTTIKVKFIHLTDGTNGKISQTRRQKQIDVLNKAYGNLNISFVESDVVEKNNSSWFHMEYGSAAERQAKTALHANPEENLNLYTAELGDGLLGWATFPWELEGDPDMDGVVVLHSTLPDGAAAPYDLGHTATHEIGHWLGLYHTFQDGCESPGDEVDDTPAHRVPDFDCSDNSACVSGQQSPVENFMNYTEDACMNKFTPGQSERARDMITAYRDKLL